MELVTVLIIVVMAAALILLANYLLDKLFRRFGFKLQIFFVFYILFPGLLVFVLVRQYTYSGEPIDYLQIGKYVALLWAAIGGYQLLDKLFKGSFIFHCIMAILIIIGMFSIPFILMNAS